MENEPINQLGEVEKTADTPEIPVPESESKDFVETIATDVKPVGDPNQTSEGEVKETPREKRKKEAQKNSMFNKKVLKVVSFAAGGLFTLVLIIFMYNNLIGTKPTTKPNKVEETPETTESVIAPPQASTEITYKEENLAFSLEYPVELELEKPENMEGSPLIYTIKYVGGNQENPVEKSEDLVDGYIFEIAVYKEINLFNVKEIAERKIEQYKLTCEKDAKYESIVSTKLDNESAYMFEVLNCPQNYKKTLVAKNEFLYEITQVYRGDIGVRQTYENKTDDLRKGFRFLVLDDIDEATEEEYRNEKYKVSFVHPKLNTHCCDLKAPASDNLVNLGVFANKAASVSNFDENFDGFGVFVEQNPSLVSFESYVASQKQKLIDEYTVVVGSIPSTNEKTVSIGGRDGVKLENYFWQGDVYYVPIPDDTKKEILIIVKPKTLEPAFNQVFSDILDSFRFIEVTD